MHELSIVMSIIDIAEKEINKAGGGIVEEIELDIGQLSTIEMEAFDFAWQQGIKGSFLEDAKLMVNRIEGKAKCLECDLEFPIENYYDSCPVCGGHFNQIIQGKELRVKTITVASQQSPVANQQSPVASSQKKPDNIKNK